MAATAFTGIYDAYGAEWPSEFINVSAMFQTASLVAKDSVYPIFITPRTLTLEQIIYSYSTAAGAAAVLSFFKAASGTAQTAAAGTALNTSTADTVNDTAATTYMCSTLVAAACNDIAAGTSIFLVPQTQVTTSLVGLNIVLRFRNRSYRTSTAGGKTWYNASGSQF